MARYITASQKLAHLQQRIERLERMASGSAPVFTTLPDGTRLGIMCITDHSNGQSRLGFVLGNGTYSAYSSLRNFNDMVTALEDRGIAGRGEGKPAVVACPNGATISMRWLSSGGDVRLGFTANRGNYFHYDSRRNFAEMVSSLQDSGVLSLD